MKKLLFLLLLSTFASAQNWYNTNWQNRVKLTLSSAKMAATNDSAWVFIELANLPAGFWSNVQDDGGDIVFTASNGTTKLPRDLIYIDATADSGGVIVKTGWNSSGNIVAYCYFDNASANESNSTATYNGAWDAVYTFAGLPATDDTLLDRTGNNYDGQLFGTMTDGDRVRAPHGYAWDFDGSDDYITMGDVMDIGDGERSLIAILKTAETTDYAGIIGKPYFGLLDGRYGMYNFSASTFVTGIYQNSVNSYSSTSITTWNNSAYNLAIYSISRTAGSKLFRNGSTVAASEATNLSGTLNTVQPFKIADYNNAAGKNLAGQISFAAVSNTALTANDATTIYNMFYDNANLFSVGTVENVPVTTRNKSGFKGWLGY